MHTTKSCNCRSVDGCPYLCILNKHSCSFSSSPLDNIICDLIFFLTVRSNTWSYSDDVGIFAALATLEIYVLLFVASTVVCKASSIHCSYRALRLLFQLIVLLVFSPSWGNDCDLYCSTTTLVSFLSTIVEFRFWHGMGWKANVSRMIGQLLILRILCPTIAPLASIRRCNNSSVL